MKQDSKPQLEDFKSSSDYMAALCEWENKTGKPVMSNTVDKLKKEYQLYPDGVHVCVANSVGDWVADCGPEGDKSSEKYAELFASAPALKKENEELFEMVRQLKNCINRLSQDGLTQHERDTEAQWEGEAHELLARINPNYYRNANQ